MLKQIIGQKPPGQPDAPASEPAAAPAPAAPEPRAMQAAAPAASKQPQQTRTASTPPMSNKNILSSDVEIKGSLKFSNDLIIDGKIEGEVMSDGSLTVGENAVVNGEIKTKSVVIFGKVVGNITVTDRCELKSAALLEGDIAAGVLAIEEGATFMGKSAVGKRAAAAAAAAAGNKPSGSAPSQGGGGGSK